MVHPSGSTRGRRGVCSDEFVWSAAALPDSQRHPDLPLALRCRALVALSVHRVNSITWLETTYCHWQQVAVLAAAGAASRIPSYYEYGARGIIDYYCILVSVPKARNKGISRNNPRICYLAPNVQRTRDHSHKIPSFVLTVFGLSSSARKKMKAFIDECLQHRISLTAIKKSMYSL